LEGQQQNRVNVVDFVFDVDYNNKFIECFTINKNTITKTRQDDEIYMVSSSNPIPTTGRHSFKIQVDNISEGLIWVGLLCEDKKA
jgi:hypothetical protein